MVILFWQYCPGCPGLALRLRCLILPFSPTCGWAEWRWWFGGAGGVDSLLKSAKLFYYRNSAKLFYRNSAIIPHTNFSWIRYNSFRGMKHLFRKKRSVSRGHSNLTRALASLQLLLRRWWPRTTGAPWWSLRAYWLTTPWTPTPSRWPTSSHSP